jgi:hypothetical protein
VQESFAKGVCIPDALVYRARDPIIPDHEVA